MTSITAPIIPSAHTIYWLIPRDMTDAEWIDGLLYLIIMIGNFSVSDRAVSTPLLRFLKKYWIPGSVMIVPVYTVAGNDPLLWFESMGPVMKLCGHVPCRGPRLDTTALRRRCRRRSAVRAMVHKFIETNHPDLLFIIRRVLLFPVFTRLIPLKLMDSLIKVFVSDQ